MKKNLVLTLAVAGVIAFATACSSKDTTTPTTSAPAATEKEADTTAAEKEADTTAAEKEADTTAAEKADEEAESTMTGTISEIKDFMFTLTSDGDDYAFTFESDKKPEGLADVKDGDTVTVTYTSTVSTVDAFTGTVVSVKAAK